jgi:hypothetical protein
VGYEIERIEGGRGGRERLFEASERVRRTPSLHKVW